MAKPNTYVLGGTVELDLTVYDTDNHSFIPNEGRISVKDPTGTTITYSGGVNVTGGELIQASGYMYILYRPPVIGWYEYESWAKDGTGREPTSTNGFEIIDRVY
jgi:hypothetical protein